MSVRPISQTMTNLWHGSWHSFPLNALTAKSVSIPKDNLTATAWEADIEQAGSGPRLIMFTTRTPGLLFKAEFATHSVSEGIQHTFTGH